MSSLTTKPSLQAGCVFLQLTGWQFPPAPLIPNMAITCQGQINPRLENKIIFNKNTNHRASGSPGSWRLG